MIIETSQLSNLELARALTVIFVFATVVFQAYIYRSSNYPSKLGDELELPLTFGWALLALIDVALGDIWWALFEALLAVLSYYLYRRRGGGGHKDTRESILEKYTPDK